MSSEHQLREEICEIGRRLWQRGMLAASDGNISARLPDGTILCTPTGVSKGFMAPEDLVRLTPDGRIIGPGRPSSEAMLHLACYCARRDVGGVVHAHPPYATAFAARGEALPVHYLTEMAVALGEVPCTEFARPGTIEVVEVALPLLARADALLLRHHGPVTVGRDVREAHHRMEWVEQGAQVAAILAPIGGAAPFTPEQLVELARIRAEQGLGVDPADYDAQDCVARIAAGWGQCAPDNRDAQPPP